MNVNMIVCGKLLMDFMKEIGERPNFMEKYKIDKKYLNIQYKTKLSLLQWPFVRFFGIQEPASTFFSILNFYFNLKMLKRFRKFVPSDSPLYWLWHIYCLVIFFSYNFP